jgi:DNA-binding NarL/FixJ family response regulator
MSSSDRMTRGAAVAVGACGFIPTGAPAAAIAKAVRLAGMGRMVSQPPPAQRALLSERQRDVLQLIAAGRTNQQIGSKLGLSANTVKGHTCALYRRLEVRNRAEAVRRGQQVGLLT